MIPIYVYLTFSLLPATFVYIAWFIGDRSLLPPQTIRRLMAAVSFGYGIFHLAVSLLPPKLLNVIYFLGFEGDRQTGIQALHFARQGPDMRSPLAT